MLGARSSCPARPCLAVRSGSTNDQQSVEQTEGRPSPSAHRSECAVGRD